ncbi:hypothetical protein GWK47_030552 [Chionoecetes opilio]|uniref:Uncharacterized protein n=1 Tax=Chionoecetes opilio TaxID=41210 RepID=A0A8J5CR05_CHIOP|nr:hypothetical protein GWK47_030552 [Chionoecetes opilio]
MHVGKDMERVAVILTGTDGQEVLLSIVGMEGRSTAENEAAKIIQWSRRKDWRQSLVEVFCNWHVRHHIHELIGGASCSIVYGPTTGPNEQLFKRLGEQLERIEPQQLHIGRGDCLHKRVDGLYT